MSNRVEPISRAAQGFNELLASLVARTDRQVVEIPVRWEEGQWTLFPNPPVSAAQLTPEVIDLALRTKQAELVDPLGSLAFFRLRLDHHEPGQDGSPQTPQQATA